MKAVKQLMQLEHIKKIIMQIWRDWVDEGIQTLSKHLSKTVLEPTTRRWAALRVTIAHLLEAGLSVFGLGIVGGGLVERLWETGPRSVQGSHTRHGRRTRRCRHPRARQAGARASRRIFALWTFGTQHASIPRCTPSHCIKVSIHPAPTPTRAATAATVQGIHIQVWRVVLACDVALWRKRVRKAWCKCICNVRHNTYMEPHTTHTAYAALIHISYNTHG